MFAQAPPPHTSLSKNLCRNGNSPALGVLTTPTAGEFALRASWIEFDRIYSNSTSKISLLLLSRIALVAMENLL